MNNGNKQQLRPKSNFSYYEENFHYDSEVFDNFEDGSSDDFVPTEDENSSSDSDKELSGIHVTAEFPNNIESNHTLDKDKKKRG